MSAFSYFDYIKSLKERRCFPLTYNSVVIFLLSGEVSFILIFLLKCLQSLVDEVWGDRSDIVRKRLMHNFC